MAESEGTGLDATLAPAAASRFMTAPRLAATAASTSSIPDLSGTTNSTPPRSRGRTGAPDWPRSAISISTQSSTVRASGPIVSSVRESGKTPCLSMRPSLVLNPTMPQKLAGARIEPPVSLPIAQGARPAATATAAPEEEPPAIARGNGVAGISRRAEMRVEPKRGKGEFREICFAKRHEAGPGEVRDNRRVALLRRRLGEERGTGGGPLARHVDEVLPGDRNAIERACRAALPAPLAARLGFPESPCAGDENE